jgi:hypothetical protein
MALQLTHLSGFGGGMSGRRLSYRGSTVQTTNVNASSVTLSTLDIGTAATDRLVVVALFYIGPRGLTGVTIGGITATEVDNDSPGQLRGYIYQASVPTGTTADVVISVSAGGGDEMDTLHVAVYALYGLTSTAKQSSVTDKINPWAMTLTNTTGALVIAAVARDGTATTFSWDSAVGVDLASTNNETLTVSFASKSNAPSNLSTTVTGSPTDPGMSIAAAWY